MKKISLYGLLLAFALVLSYIEALIPLDFLIPGIKLGLANFIAVLLLYCSGVGSAIFINILRIILSNLLFGGIVSFLYALAGGICSFAAMMLCKKFRCFSPAGASIAGGAAHQIGQIAVASVVLQTPAVFKTLPALVPVGVVCGLLTGLPAAICVARFEKRRSRI